MSNHYIVKLEISFNQFYGTYADTEKQAVSDAISGMKTILSADYGITESTIQLLYVEPSSYTEPHHEIPDNT